MKSNLKKLPLDELTKWVQNYVADEHVSDQIISIIYKGDMMASALNELNPFSEYANILVRSWENTMKKGLTPSLAQLKRKEKS